MLLLGRVAQTHKYAVEDANEKNKTDIIRYLLYGLTTLRYRDA